MTDFYRIKFSISARDEIVPDFLGELIECIREWLEKKYGDVVIEKIIPSWLDFRNGGTFGDYEKINRFYAETVSNESDICIENRTWACRIVKNRGS